MALATTQKGTSPAAEYITKMKTLTDDMASASKKLNDEELCSYIVVGLDFEYNSLVSSITACVKPISFSELSFLPLRAGLNFKVATILSLLWMPSQCSGRGSLYEALYGSSNFVCKLDKALYGLKHASWDWYSKLSSKLQMLGFTPSRADTSLFFYSTKHLTMFVLVYVNDIIVASSSPSATISLLWDLEKDFALKDFGLLHFFLGIEVTTIGNGLLLSQGKYVAELLQKADMVAYKHVPTPLSTSDKLSSHSGDIQVFLDHKMPHIIVVLLGACNTWLWHD
jgi:hypothetical protein